jgi:hypothetical protein
MAVYRGAERSNEHAQALRPPTSKAMTGASNRCEDALPTSCRITKDSGSVISLAVYAAGKICCMCGMNTKPIVSAHATSTAVDTIADQTLETIPSGIGCPRMTVVEQAIPKPRNITPHMPPPRTAPAEGGSEIKI